MRYTRIVFALTLASAVALGWVAAAAGQERTAASCSAGERLVGDLGLSGLECNCVYSISKEGERWWKFRSEPRVGSVRPGSPADGEIQAGDMITAIDGLLITTSEAGRRFANISPGDEVTLTVRHNDRVRRVTLVAKARCERVDVTSVALQQPEVVLAPAAKVEVAVVPTVKAVPVPVVEVAPVLGIKIKTMFPEGWFGFGIRCNCEVYTEEEGEVPVWSFREPPEISLVEDGSPADSAGLRRGDLLLEIDGVDIMSEEGGRRFGSVKAGDTVMFKYRRGGQTATVSVTAGKRLAPKPPDPPIELEALVSAIEAQQLEQAVLAERLIVELEAGQIAKGLVEAQALQAEIVKQQEVVEQELRQSLLSIYRPEPEVIIGESPSALRFTGALGNVEVEVRGPREVVVVAEEDELLTIVAGETRILLRVVK